jgi:hypothetical protein
MARKITPLICEASAMDSGQIATDIGRVELLHATPGRIRLRIPEMKGNPAKAREVEQQVAGLKPLRRIEANPVTGSILVTYDPDDSASLEELRRWFLPELDPAALTSPPDQGDDDVEAVTPSAVQAVLSKLQAINANVRTTTGGLDLRILVPAMMVLMGIKTLVTEGKRKPAWYNYFWFAFGTFCTLNRRATTESSPSALAEPPAAVNGNGEAELGTVGVRPLQEPV